MIEIPWGEWIILLLIFAVAALAQGVLGFAFGIVAMTLLPFVMDFRDAVMLLAVLNAAVMLFALYWQRSSFRWGAARYLLIGALVNVLVAWACFTWDRDVRLSNTTARWPLAAPRGEQQVSGKHRAPAAARSRPPRWCPR